MKDPLVIAGRAFRSRLIVGTGKYRSFAEMQRAHEASGADMITVAVRRVNLTDRSKESLLDYIDRDKYFLLPNTAGCYSAEEAVRTARLGREVGLSNWVKLEVIGDQQTLFPDTAELLKATEVLVKEGFVVLPYTNDDLVVALRLVDAGAAAVMPLGAPIGSGMGIQNHAALRILRERLLPEWHPARRFRSAIRFCLAAGRASKPADGARWLWLVLSGAAIHYAFGAAVFPGDRQFFCKQWFFDSAGPFSGCDFGVSTPHAHLATF
jgi:hypothetical protein